MKITSPASPFSFIRTFFKRGVGGELFRAREEQDALT